MCTRAVFLIARKTKATGPRMKKTVGPSKEAIVCNLIGLALAVAEFEKAGFSIETIQYSGRERCDPDSEWLLVEGFEYLRFREAVAFLQEGAS